MYGTEVRMQDAGVRCMVQDAGYTQYHQTKRFRVLIVGCSDTH